MKAKEIIALMESKAEVSGDTCDELICGDENKEVKKLGVTMFATAELIKRAITEGYDMLIVHEPVFYCLSDEEEALVKEKRKLIEEGGLVIYRNHDHLHNTLPDGINEGERFFLGLQGECSGKVLTLKEPISPLDLARRAKYGLGVSQARVVGNREVPVSRYGMFFGSYLNRDTIKAFINDEVDCIITGEVCEYSLCEYVRDANYLGRRKALVVLGHIGSERDGMRYFALKLGEELKPLTVNYLECDEVYSLV